MYPQKGALQVVVGQPLAVAVAVSLPLLWWGRLTGPDQFALIFGIHRCSRYYFPNIVVLRCRNDEQGIRLYLVVPFGAAKCSIVQLTLCGVIKRAM